MALAAIRSTENQDYKRTAIPNLPQVPQKQPVGGTSPTSQRCHFAPVPFVASSPNRQLADDTPRARGVILPQFRLWHLPQTGNWRMIPHPPEVSFCPSSVCRIFPKLAIGGTSRHFGQDFGCGREVFSFVILIRLHPWLKKLRGRLLKRIQNLELLVAPSALEVFR